MIADGCGGSSEMGSGRTFSRWPSKRRPEGEARGCSQLERDAKGMGENCGMHRDRTSTVRMPPTRLECGGGEWG